MGYRTLISTEDLHKNLTNPNWVLVDCSFYLDDTEKGRREYLQSHIPRAQYAHLDDHLSGQVIAGITGRHPLPSIGTITETLTKMGVDRNVQVIVYDSRGGAIAAVRLWWMLRWLGHADAAVLDGGIQKWISERRPVISGAESSPPREFKPFQSPELYVGVDDVISASIDPEVILIDARARDRYTGKIEPIDLIAGHIPGAINSPYENLLSDDGTFKSTDELRDIYSHLLKDTKPENSIVYCGSGVTSIMHILAMEHIGLGRGRIYIGSWSEWITDEKRPIAFS